LQSQITALKVQLNNLGSNKQDDPIAFTQETDEEELARETEWILIESTE
jgi:hypothetical protein